MEEPDTVAAPRDKKTAREVVAEECIGSILREFPSEWLDKSLAEIAKAAQAGESRRRKQRNC